MVSENCPPNLAKLCCWKYMPTTIFKKIWAWNIFWDTLYSSTRISEVWELLVVHEFWYLFYFIIFNFRETLENSLLKYWNYLNHYFRTIYIYHFKVQKILKQKKIQNWLKKWYVVLNEKNSCCLFICMDFIFIDWLLA